MANLLAPATFAQQGFTPPGALSGAGSALGSGVSSFFGQAGRVPGATGVWSPQMPAPSQVAAAPAATQAPMMQAAPAAKPTQFTTIAGAPAAPTANPNEVTLPSGMKVQIDEKGNVMNAPSSFKIDTSGAIPSSAMQSTQTSGDLQNVYRDYLNKLAQAYTPTQDYLNAIKQYQDAQLAGANISAQYLTGGSAIPGDTLGFAQGMEGRDKALNAIQQMAASNNLNVQQTIRQGNIDATKALVGGAQPQTLSYGQTLQSPLGGAPIAQGNVQPSFSAQASPFGGYLVFNQRTGEYQSIGADQLAGGAGSMGTQIPSFLQPSIGTAFGGQQYMDSSVITPQQMPYAQMVSANLGIPLLSKEDVNKLQEAQATYNAGVGLISSVSALSNGLIHATTPAQAVLQAASLQTQAAIPGTQARLYQDARNGFLSLITRAAGEKGTLAEGDVLRIAAALPAFNDTVQNAQTKLATLNDIFQSSLQGNVSAYLGSKIPKQSGSSSVNMSAYAW